MPLTDDFHAFVSKTYTVPCFVIEPLISYFFFKCNVRLLGTAIKSNKSFSAEDVCALTFARARVCVCGVMAQSIRDSLNKEWLM